MLKFRIDRRIASLAVAAVAMLRCSNDKFHISQDISVKQRLASLFVFFGPFLFYHRHDDLSLLAND